MHFGMLAVGGLPKWLTHQIYNPLPPASAANPSVGVQEGVKNSHSTVGKVAVFFWCFFLISVAYFAHRRMNASINK